MHEPPDRARPVYRAIRRAIRWRINGEFTGNADRIERHIDGFICVQVIAHTRIQMGKGCPLKSASQNNILRNDFESLFEN